MILHEKEFKLVSNLLKRCNYISNLVWIDKIQKWFLYVSFFYNKSLYFD